MDNQLQHLVLAAYLHDIGKFMQRAEVEISQSTQNLMSSAGPSKDGRSSHFHVQWTSEFFEEYLGDIELPPVNTLDNHAKQIAFKHHNPSTPLEWMLAEADRLSSGMERGESHYERNVHKRKRMVPVRSILTPNGKIPDSFSYCPLSRLTSKDDSCYPISLKENDEDLVGDYKTLWEGFLEEWHSRTYDGFHANLAFLNVLFERFLWSVPASTIDEIPDNSLYEHSQAVAALASCLYAYHKENHSIQESSIKDRSLDKYLLVGADLSGIQRFIFAMAHSGGGKVAKRLRARSFMVSRIPQILAMQIIEEFGLPFFNIILSAGGKFHLLLPNTSSTLTLLQRKEKECQEWLHESFQGLLTLNMATVPMNGEDFMGKNIGGKFIEATEALTTKKFQPLKRRLVNNPNWETDAFIMPEKVIEKELATGLYDVEPKYKEEDLGRILPKADCMAVYPDLNGDFEILGWSFSLKERAVQLDRGYSWLISFEKGAESSSPYKKVPVYYEYRASYIPQEQGEILSFEEIGQKSTGRDAIAYLKADVDNMGFLIQHGLDWKFSRSESLNKNNEPKIGWTLSKMTSFSRSMEFFFAGRVNNLLEEEFPMIYTVFCGGDDVFLVGPWDKIHDFSLRLREEFQKFTGNANHLTLSAGITIQRPLTPVWLANEQTEEAEKAAKSLSVNERGTKNQLCTFNHLIPWEEANYVFNEIDQVFEWLKDKELSASMLQNFIYFAEMATMYQLGKNVEGLRYLPLLSYTASRNLKPESPVHDWIKNLQDIDGKAIRHLGFIANYCLNLNRGKSEAR